MNAKHLISLFALACLLVPFSPVNLAAAQSGIGAGPGQEPTPTVEMDPNQLLSSLETLNRDLFSLNQMLAGNAPAGQAGFNHRQLKFEEYRNRHQQYGNQLKSCNEQLKTFYTQVEAMYRTRSKDPRYLTANKRYYAALQLYNTCLDQFKNCKAPEEIRHFAPVFVNTHMREKVKVVGKSDRLCLPTKELEAADQLLFVGKYDDVDLYLVTLGNQSYYLITEMPGTKVAPEPAKPAADPNQVVLICSDEFSAGSVGDAFAFNHLDLVLKLNLHQAQLPEDQFNRLMNLFEIAKSYVKPN